MPLMPLDVGACLMRSKEYNNFSNLRSLGKQTGFENMVQHFAEELPENVSVQQEGTSDTRECKDWSRAGRSRGVAIAGIRSSASTVGSTMKARTGV